MRLRSFFKQAVTDLSGWVAGGGGTNPDRRHLFPLVIVLMGILVYANTLQGPFVFDDGVYLINNPVVKDFRYYSDPALASNAIYQGRVDQNFKTRILTFFTFAVNHRLHGFQPFGYHLVNLVIHLCSGLLVYRLILLTMDTPCFNHHLKIASSSREGKVAFLGALFFVVHPVNTESVSYISQRFTSLAAMLCLLSLVMYVSWRLSAMKAGPDRGDCPAMSAGAGRRRLMYAGAVVSAFLAMFAKEISFTLPLLIVLFDLMFFPGKVRERLLLLPFVLMMAIIPAIVFSKTARYADVTRLYDSVSQTGGENMALSYLFTQFRVIVTYLRLLLFPANLNLDYDYPRYSSFFQPPVVSSFVFLAILVAGAVFLSLRAARQGNEGCCYQRMVSFGIFWFFIALSVESSFMPLADLVFEHRLYLPSVGVVIAVVGWVGLLPLPSASRKGAAGFFLLPILLITLLAAAAYSRNNFWADRVLLWEDTVRKSPDKPRPHLNLAGAYKTAGRLAEALAQYQIALKLCLAREEDATSIYNGISEILILRKDSEQERRISQEQLEWAKSDLVKKLGKAGALEDFALLYNDLGVMHSKLSQAQEAEDAFRKSLSIKGDFAQAYLNLGNHYSRLDRFDEALAALTRSSQLDPDNPQTQSDLGDLLAALSKHQEAGAAYSKALELNPDSIDAAFRLALYHAFFRDYFSAERVLGRVERLVGHDPRFFHEKGLYYERIGRIADAERAFEQAIRLNGKVSTGYTNLGAFYMRQGMTDKALASYIQAVRIAPGDPDIHFNMGHAFAEKGDYRAAASAYGRVVDLSPNDLEARRALEGATAAINDSLVPSVRLR